MKEIEFKRETALKAIETAVVANLSEAAELVDVPDSTLQTWRDMSPEFKRRWDGAIARAKARTYDKIESAMVQRALDVRNPVGVTAGIFLLKSNRAAQYADKPQNVSNITVNVDKAQFNLGQAAAPRIEGLSELEPEEAE